MFTAHDTEHYHHLQPMARPTPHVTSSLAENLDSREPNQGRLRRGWPKDSSRIRPRRDINFVSRHNPPTAADHMSLQLAQEAVKYTDQFADASRQMSTEHSPIMESRAMMCAERDPCPPALSMLS